MISWRRVRQASQATTHVTTVKSFLQPLNPD